MMPLFCGGLEHPQACILLRCAPKRVDSETVDPRFAAHGPTADLISILRKKYTNVDIFCQSKGYMDAPTFLAWFKFSYLPSAGNIASLLVVDNLAAHATSEIGEFAAAHNVCLLFSPPSCTDMIQVTDIGLGHAIKRRMKKKFGDHFAAHSEQWQRGEVPPAKRKQLHVQWLSEATAEFYTDGGQKTVQTVFGRCGLRTPLDESGEQLRKIKGHNTVLKLSQKYPNSMLYVTTQRFAKLCSRVNYFKYFQKISNLRKT